MSATAHGDRPHFFARSALVLAGIVLVSFSLTYYWPLATGTRQFQALHHVHDLAFFGWIGLDVCQTQLVARGRITRHRENGLAPLCRARHKELYAARASNSGLCQGVATRGIVSPSLRRRGNEGLLLPAEIARIQ